MGRFAHQSQEVKKHMNVGFKCIQSATVVFCCGALVFGCAEKPVQGTDAALQAIQAAKEAGAQEYAPEALRLAEDEYQKAQEEITVQDTSFVLTRNYETANTILTKVVSNAQEAKNQAVANKQQVKVEAENAVAQAKASLEEAKILLTQAPKGKGTQADLQALQGDIQAAETTLSEIEPIMAKEDFLGAKAKAESAQGLAARVHEQVATAMQKTGKGKA